MKIATKSEHEIRFRVEAFWPEEGGMGHDAFGPIAETLEEAIALLQLARAQKHPPYVEWVIVGEVKTTVSGTV